MDAARVLGSSSAAKRFELRKELGAGGYGTVWEAHDRERGERVALKALSRIAAEAVFRFKQEFRAAQDLSHPNLVRLGELFEMGGGWFFSMELVEGSDFCEYVRPDGHVDHARLKQSLPQVLHGLAALHAAGLVHRDIKPGNVRVTTEGRVVILDFGMSSRWMGSGMSTQIPGGTAAYMAPEQAFPSPVGPAADLYAVGAMLYETLTGELPFDGSPLRVLLDKQSQLPAPPATRVEGVPPELDLLCMQLMQVNPAARPTLEQTLAAVGGTAASGHVQGSALVSGGTQTGARLCIGREPELRVLEEARSRARRGQPQVVFIEGEAGIGKSALLGHFLDEVRRDDAASVVLQGRCHEFENVAHKGFDGLVDALARYLKRLDHSECEAFLPTHAALLPRVFPVLGRVPAIVGRRLVHAAADPALLKRQAFDALFELLGRIAQRRPLIVAIDDLHFSDLESIRTLSHNLTGESARGILLVVSLRPMGELDVELRTTLGQLSTRARATTIELGPLSAEDSTRLVREVLGHSLSSTLCQVVVRESAGHPMLLLALAQHALRHPSLAGSLDLEEVLRARLSGLGHTARSVLDAVALAGVPLARNALSSVTGLSANDVSTGLAELRAEKLLKTDRQGGSECFHPELRAIAAAQIDATVKRNLHRALALALGQQPGTDAAVVAGHWVLGGEPARAVPTLLRAADKAIVALGFDRAASLYRLALEHGRALPEQERWGIRVQLAHALAGAGAGPDAAREYLACAALAVPGEALELRRRAVHQLLRSLRVDEGLKVAEELLTELGVPVERDPRGAGLSSSWQRARLRLRGLSFTPRSEDELAPDQRRDLDLMHSLTTAWTRVDLVPGYALSTRYVRLALDAGETNHVINALAAEAEQLSLLEDLPQPRTNQALASAEALAARSRSEYAKARVLLARGTVAWVRFDLRAAAAALSRADQLFAEGCQDANWERTLAQSQFLSTSLQQGHFTRHAQSVERWLGEARARGDRAARSFIALLGGSYQGQLVRDDPDAALEEIDAAMAAWSGSTFSMVHACAPWARLTVARYRDPLGAADQIQGALDEAWVLARRQGLLRYHASSVVLLEQRARARLAVALTSQGEPRRAALGLVTRDIAAIRGHRWGAFDAVALELSAEVEWLTGKPELALRTLRAALSEQDEAGFGRQGHATRYLLGRIVQGDEGAALVGASLEWARREGVRNPARYFAVLEALLEARP